MVRFSIRKKFWKALGLLYQMMVETTGNGNDEGKRERQGKPRSLQLLLEVEK